MRMTARAPLGLRPAGCGIDLSPFCDLYGGHVLNVATGPYTYTIIETLPGGVVELRATDIGVGETLGTIATLPASPPLALESHRDTFEWLRRTTVDWPGNGDRAGVS